MNVCLLELAEQFSHSKAYESGWKATAKWHLLSSFTGRLREKEMCIEREREYLPDPGKSMFLYVAQVLISSLYWRHALPVSNLLCWFTLSPPPLPLLPPFAFILSPSLSLSLLKQLTPQAPQPVVALEPPFFVSLLEIRYGLCTCWRKHWWSNARKGHGCWWNMSAFAFVRLVMYTINSLALFFSIFLLLCRQFQINSETMTMSWTQFFPIISWPSGHCCSSLSYPAKILLQPKKSLRFFPCSTLQLLMSAK